jgi:hypothetical protein
VAVALNSGADELGQTFATVIADRRSVAGLWVSTSSEGYHLWLLVHEADADEERHLYRSLNILDQQFSNVDFQLHILNPSRYTIPVNELLPSNARKIFERAASA